MTEYPFVQVDVFTPEPFRGNPLAVVHGADDLHPELMQRIANWTNLSETAFLLEPTSPEADYRVRIFTGSRELPFAGHPTLGSAHAWLSRRSQPVDRPILVQECAAGLVRIRRDGVRLAFAAPPLTNFEPVEDELLRRIAAGLGISPGDIVASSWLVNGPRWIGILLDSAAQVLRLQVDQALVAGLEIGVVGRHEPGSGAAFEVRGFLPGDIVPEDPVTGSLNAGLAEWLIRDGYAPSSYVAAQGTALGRHGRVHVDRDDDGLWIGGQVHTLISGTIDI